MYKYLNRGLTYDKDLSRVGKAFLKDKFLGTFSSDVKLAKINRLSKGKTTVYFIINVDGKTEPGSHWLAIIKTGGVYHIYDTFARKLSNLIPNFLKTVRHEYTQVNGKSDQHVNSEVCGQRSLALLLYGYKYGIDKIKDI
jgi:hypothetical protein